LPSGTTLTAEKLPPGPITIAPPFKQPLTATEIQDIILLCARANVRSIEVSGLRLEFGEGQAHHLTSAPPSPVEPTRPTEPTLSDHEHEEIGKEALALDEAQFREDQLAMMIIEDPLQAELLIMNHESDIVPERETG
jgi:hypothetical protein